MHRSEEAPSTFSVGIAIAALAFTALGVIAVALGWGVLPILVIALVAAGVRVALSSELREGVVSALRSGAMPALVIIAIGVAIDSLIFGPLERRVRERWGLQR